MFLHINGTDAANFRDYMINARRAENSGDTTTQLVILRMAAELIESIMEREASSGLIAE